VAWSPVAGAERYSLTRSVPPAAQTSVELPDPTDTVYIDRDVRPGSTYYYLVGAVNEGGITGMRKAPPSVKAEDMAARRAVPPPPSNFRAVLNGRNVALSWSASGADLRFTLERGVAMENRPPAWIRLAADPRCCYTNDNLEAQAPGTRVQYRIRATSQYGNMSEPALSNEITVPDLAANDTTAGGRDTTAQQPGDTTSTGSADTTGSVRTQVRPAVIGPGTRLKVGESVNLARIPAFTGLRLRNPRWVSLNESKATVSARGVVQGRAVGVAHIVAIGTVADGSIASMVQRVQVRRR
jgi:Bacterial Ig-like domain (group 2)